MINPWLPERHRILEIKEETDMESTFVVEFNEPSIRHGQFFQISLPKIGEAPISVSNFTDSTIEFTIRKVGMLTNVLFDLHAGDDLYIRGPYGNGFPLEDFKGKHIIVIAGGTGVSPVRSTLNHYLNNPQDFKDVYAIAGFRDAQHVLFENDLTKWRNAPHFHTTLTLDQGERVGFQEGFAMKYVKDIPFQDFQDDYAVIIVGPPVMMKFTAQECMKYGVTEDHIYVSFERKMSCALGKCGHCKINETYVCLEGPVFPYTKAQGLVD